MAELLVVIAVVALIALPWWLTYLLTPFDSDDAAIPPAPLPGNLANIRRVAITMTTQSAAVEDRGRVTLASSVRPRTL